jgi:cell shape-determining protein MreC
MQLSSLSALCFAAALFCTSLPALAQTSDTNSTLPEPLWSSLLELTSNLPGQIDSFRTSLEGQVNSLSATVERLQTSNDNLTASNSSLQGSVQTLKQQNADLTNSLSTSEQVLAISEQARQQSETALQSSMQSIIKAQADAKALELKNGLLGALATLGGASTAILCTIAAGHFIFHWW